MVRDDKLHRVHALLVEAYGEPHWQRHFPPVDELVSTILSQATNDANRDRGFRRLKERFDDWEAVMAAPVQDVKAAIEPAGLANQKAPRIQGALRAVAVERGELSLDFLADWPVAQAKDWLTSLKGVGHKTASIILLFAFGMPAFPVDTHVHRIMKRVGLVDAKTSAEKAHHWVEEVGEPKTFYALHLNLIRHGREVCQARRPRCEVCDLASLCDYFAERRQEDETADG
jgi:endonuclease-3